MTKMVWCQCCSHLENSYVNLKISCDGFFFSFDLGKSTGQHLKEAGVLEHENPRSQAKGSFWAIDGAHSS